MTTANQAVASEQVTESLFPNGMGFLYPRSEEGPSIYGIAEGAWLFAALIKGIRDQVWKCDPTQPNAVASAWAGAGLIEVMDGCDEHGEPQKSCRLTGAGQRVRDCQDLLEYEFSMMQQQLDGNFKTDPVKYAKLRGGLEAYTLSFMPDMLNWVATSNASQQPVKFFDFCGGNGLYLNTFLQNDQKSQGMLFDRDVSGYDYGAQAAQRAAVKQGDAFGDDEWFAEQAGCYDIVLMSEILHCKGPEDRAFLLRRAKSLLNPDGVLLVIEQFPNLRLEWRMQAMTAGGRTLTDQQVAAEAQEAGFMATSGIHSFTHYGLRLEQIQ